MMLAGSRHVHFLGIGGIGMSALARLLLARGQKVSGCDSTVGEQAAALERLGAHICAGHDPSHLTGVDLLVVTSAVSRDNEELLAAADRGIPVMKRAEALAEILNSGQGIAVAGTHGKTTTSALIGWILTVAGCDPTILIGGISVDLGSNARVGGTDLIVGEADEYDASFLRLRPEIAVITNVEPDHLDFYGTEERLYDAFRQFTAGVRRAVVVCADDERALEIAKEVALSPVTYGLERGTWQALDIDEDGRVCQFTATGVGPPTRYAMQLAGAHNVRNALAAIAVAHILGVDTEVIVRALASFGGVQRRSEIKGSAAGVTVIDDYAHHPTEIRTTLAALKRRFKRPIKVVFQPHTYSRTRAFLPEFASAFEDADAVYLLDIYAARENDRLGLSDDDLAREMKRFHPRVEHVGTMDRALEQMLCHAESGDILLTMGAGDVFTLGPRLLEALERR